MMSAASVERPLRLGILGAARIAHNALIQPARTEAGATIAVVAARDPERAAAFAKAHGIPRVARDYAAVVEDPGIDAIYNPLPMNLHAEWSVRALRAGKHVLCEKPFAANAAQAEEMVTVANREGRVLMEAFHYRYHPLFERVLQLRDALGPLQHLEARFTTTIADPTDLRHHFATAGGATMDLGCYPLHWLRQVVGEEPEVVRASAQTGNPHIDLSMSARLRFPSGVTAAMYCSMAPGQPFANSLVISAVRGSVEVDNPLAPQLGHRLVWRLGGEVHQECVEAGTTYEHQLRAFVAAVRSGCPLPTSGQDAVNNMRLIDAVYRAAGLPLRGTEVEI